MIFAIKPKPANDKDGLLNYLMMAANCLERGGSIEEVKYMLSDLIDSINSKDCRFAWNQSYPFAPPVSPAQLHVPDEAPAVPSIQDAPPIVLPVMKTPIYDAILLVPLDMVPVVCTERHTPRKEQARLARKLLASLGIKGVSVTTPNYSMAQSVTVRIHKYVDASGNLNAKLYTAAVEKIRAILDAAFPNHVDRSDSASDHFDYCWSVF